MPNITRNHAITYTNLAVAFPGYYSRNKEKENPRGHLRVPNTLTFKMRPSTHSPAA